MSLTIEAIYEAGVFKPLAPLPDLKEFERVKITLEPALQQNGLIARQRRQRIEIASDFAREIGDGYLVERCS